MNYSKYWTDVNGTHYELVNLTHTDGFNATAHYVNTTTLKEYSALWGSFTQRFFPTATEPKRLDTHRKPTL